MRRPGTMDAVFNIMGCSSCLAALGQGTTVWAHISPIRRLGAYISQNVSPTAELSVHLPSAGLYIWSFCHTFIILPQLVSSYPQLSSLTAERTETDTLSTPLTSGSKVIACVHSGLVSFPLFRILCVRAWLHRYPIMPFMLHDGIAPQSGPQLLQQCGDAQVSDAGNPDCHGACRTPCFLLLCSHPCAPGLLRCAVQGTGHGAGTRHAHVHGPRPCPQPT